MHRYDVQIQRAWVVTMTGVWIVILLVAVVSLPLSSSPVNIAEARIGRYAPIRAHDLVITVNADGAIYVRQRRVTVPQLAYAIVIASRPREEPPYWRDVFVQVDKRAPFRAVRDVLTAAQLANRRFLIFVATPPP